MRFKHLANQGHRYVPSREKRSKILRRRRKIVECSRSSGGEKLELLQDVVLCKLFWVVGCFVFLVFMLTIRALTKNILRFHCCYCLIVPCTYRTSPCFLFCMLPLIISRKMNTEGGHLMSRVWV